MLLSSWPQGPVEKFRKPLCCFNIWYKCNKHHTLREPTWTLQSWKLPSDILWQNCCSQTDFLMQKGLILHCKVEFYLLWLLIIATQQNEICRITIKLVDMKLLFHIIHICNVCSPSDSPLQHPLCLLSPFFVTLCLYHHVWGRTRWKPHVKWNSHCIMSKKMGMVAFRNSISGTSVISRIGPTISGMNLILWGP